MRLRPFPLLAALALLPLALPAASAEETCIADRVCVDPDHVFDRLENPPDPRTLVPWPDNVSCTAEDPDLCPIPPR